jgi:hypothetical protein
VFRESLWRRGRVSTAVRIGVPAGVAFGAIQFAVSGRVLSAIFQGLFFAVFFGGATASLMWRQWAAARDLAPEDRATVARSVRRGEPVWEARLAPAVIEYANIVRATSETERRRRFLLWIFAVGTFVLAVAGTVSGSVREAAVFWALFAFWPALMLWLPKRQAATESRAAAAEDAARSLMQTRPDNPSP